VSAHTPSASVHVPSTLSYPTLTVSSRCGTIITHAQALSSPRPSPVFCTRNTHSLHSTIYSLRSTIYSLTPLYHILTPLYAHVTLNHSLTPHLTFTVFRPTPITQAHALPCVPALEAMGMFCSTLLRVKRYSLARSYLHGTGSLNIFHTHTQSHPYVCTHTKVCTLCQHGTGSLKIFHTHADTPICMHTYKCVYALPTRHRNS
jgi:hypothetical protein